MARPIYSYELEDPDFSWLISKYRESHPGCQSVEATCLPVVIICGDDDCSGTTEILSPLASEKAADAFGNK